MVTGSAVTFIKTGIQKAMENNIADLYGIITLHGLVTLVRKEIILQGGSIQKISVTIIIFLSGGKNS